METEGYFRANQIRGRRTKKEKPWKPKILAVPLREGWAADLCVRVVKFFNCFKISKVKFL